MYMKKILFLIILSVISSILTAYLYIESVLWMSICAIINFIVNSLIYSTILEIKEKNLFGSKQFIIQCKWVDEKGVEYKREQCKYEFVRPVTKAERLANKGKNKKK